jgi:hypothetical protein
VPIRTVLFTKLCKYDGQKTATLSARDFHQISGRAGRKGFDEQGWVVVQAPEHIIDNLKQEQKAAGDARKLRKLVKHKPPEKGFVAWNKGTFARLVSSPPEPLVSRFQVSHGMLLNVLSRNGDGCRAMQQLIRRCHDSPQAKQGHRDRAWQLFRSLLDRKIIEINPPGSGTTHLRVNVELQDDFSLDQTLSLYLVDTIQLLDPTAPDYPLDLLTLVESILENPDIVLRKQLDRVKDEKMAEMKMEGIPFEERMLELEKLEYPKPKREFVYSTFNQFAARHPWVGEENIRPKSIAREMFENFQSFADYIRDYELQRAEGVLLRYLSNAYKVLDQTVPEVAKTEGVVEIEAYFGTIVRQVDSSLLDEWERLRDPSWVSREETLEEKPAESVPSDITRNRKAFTVLVRNEIFSFLRELALKDYATAVECLEVPTNVAGEPWTAEKLEGLMKEYYADHERVCLDPGARNIRNTFVKEADDRKSWQVQQMLVDPEEHNDWLAEFHVDLERSRASAKPFLLLQHIRAV